MSIINYSELIKATTHGRPDLHCLRLRLMQGPRGCPHTVDVTFLKQYVSKHYVPHKAATVPGVSKSPTLFCILDQRTLDV
jgi:hypothetical protein